MKKLIPVLALLAITLSGCIWYGPGGYDHHGYDGGGYGGGYGHHDSDGGGYGGGFHRGY